MSFLRLTIITLTALLTLAACGRDDESVTVAESAAVNELLAYVPADTPYVFANLEPVPDEVLDSFLERMQPVLDSMQLQLSKTRNELESGQQLNAGDPGARLAHALIQEIDGKVSRAGLETLGIDLRSKKVVYGHGAFPVIRLGLSEPQVLRATIQRVLDNAGISAPEQDFQGVSYWRLGDEGAPADPVSLYVSILDDHLAISLFPTAEEVELLPALLGLETPADSDAQSRLAGLNHKHDYTPYGSGIIDVHRMADEFMSPDTAAGRLMALSGDFDPANLPPVCATEIHEIIDNAPMMTMGVTELTTDAWAFQYRLETPQSLAGQLMGLVSEIPAANAFSDRVLEFSLGLRFGPVRDFLREKAMAIVEDPYECEHLLDLNTSAAQSLAQLDQPMPPFLNNFRGLRVSLSEFLLGRTTLPENARGHLAVHVEKPEMFIGMAQMFLPDLSTLAIQPGEAPVRLPDSLVPVEGIEAWAAMSDEAIGLAVGPGEVDTLPGFLDADAGPEGMFLSAAYDMDAYLDYTEEIGKHYGNAGDDGDESLHASAARELQEAMREAYREMAGRSHSTLRFTADGFVAENRVTFKPESP